MRRLAVVVALSLAGFVVAMVTFSGTGGAACPTEAPVERSYTATFEQPVRDGAGPHVVVLSGMRGRPVTGAQVCLRPGPPDGQSSTEPIEASELGGGRYEVSGALDTDDPDGWVLLVAPEGDAEPFAVPVDLRTGGTDGAPAGR